MRCTPPRRTSADRRRAVDARRARRAGRAPRHFCRLFRTIDRHPPCENSARIRPCRPDTPRIDDHGSMARAPARRARTGVDTGARRSARGAAVTQCSLNRLLLRLQRQRGQRAFLYPGQDGAARVLKSSIRDADRHCSAQKAEPQTLYLLASGPVRTGLDGDRSRTDGHCGRCSYRAARKRALHRTADPATQPTAQPDHQQRPPRRRWPLLLVSLRLRACRPQPQRCVVDHHDRSCPTSAAFPPTACRHRRTTAKPARR